MQTYKLTHWPRPAWSLLAPYTIERGLRAEEVETLRAAYEARGDRVRVDPEDPEDLARWLEAARIRRETRERAPLPLSCLGPGLGLYEWGAAWTLFGRCPAERGGRKVGL